VKDQIVQHGLTATSALIVVFQDYKTIFEQIADEYLRHRLADVRDVMARIQSQWVVSANNGFDLGKDPLVVVAREILPSQAVSLGDINVAGIVTETVSNTSHAAILARSRAIPAVSGLIGITAELRSGDTVIVDGRSGDVIFNPGPDVLAVYRTMQRDFAQLRDRLIERRDLPTVTPDGIDVELMANIHNLAGVRLAVDFGAVGVGLYRTEYFFLTHPSIQDEDEQVETYSQVIEAALTRRVTIRTLDLRGDKVIPFLGHRGEANPFLGWLKRRNVRKTR